MRNFPLLYAFLFLILPNSLFAKLDTAVLRVCFEKDSAPFVISTKDSEIAEKENFVSYKNGESFIRRFSLKMDGTPFFMYRPFSDNCISIINIPPGTHSFAVDFKSADYTFLEVSNIVRHNFKADLMYEGIFKVVKGDTASVEISQSRNRISLYQSLDNKPVDSCLDKCEVPSGIPLYFVIKGSDSEVSCPAEYTLILRKAEKKNVECYSDKNIREMLQKVVSENRIVCKSNSEYAHFNVYGEGCDLTLEADSTGLRSKEPEIFMIPLEKQSIKYFIQIDSDEEKSYIFSVENKGKEIIPSSGSVIKFKEIIN